jgi:hypothetical protein
MRIFTKQNHNMGTHGLVWVNRKHEKVQKKRLTTLARKSINNIARGEGEP